MIRAVVAPPLVFCDSCLGSAPSESVPRAFAALGSRPLNCLYFCRACAGRIAREILALDAAPDQGDSQPADMEPDPPGSQDVPRAAPASLGQQTATARSIGGGVEGEEYRDELGGGVGALLRLGFARHDARRAASTSGQTSSDPGPSSGPGTSSEAPQIIDLMATLKAALAGDCP